MPGTLFCNLHHVLSVYCILNLFGLVPRLVWFYARVLSEPVHFFDAFPLSICFGVDSLCILCTCTLCCRHPNLCGCTALCFVICTTFWWLLSIYYAPIPYNLWQSPQNGCLYPVYVSWIHQRFVIFWMTASLFCGNLYIFSRLCVSIGSVHWYISVCLESVDSLLPVGHGFVFGDVYCLFAIPFLILTRIDSNF